MLSGHDRCKVSKAFGGAIHVDYLDGREEHVVAVRTRVGDASDGGSMRQEVPSQA